MGGGGRGNDWIRIPADQEADKKSVFHLMSGSFPSFAIFIVFIFLFMLLDVRTSVKCDHGLINRLVCYPAFTTSIASIHDRVSMFVKS